MPPYFPKIAFLLHPTLSCVSYSKDSHSYLYRTRNLAAETGGIPNFVPGDAIPKNEDSTTWKDWRNWLIILQGPEAPRWASKDILPSDLFQPLIGLWTERCLFLSGTHEVLGDDVVYAYGDSHVIASEHSTVYAFGNSSVSLSDRAVLYASDNCKFTAGDNSLVRIRSKDVAGIAAGETVIRADDAQNIQRVDVISPCVLFGD